MRQQHRRLRVRQHVGEPVARMGRIERNIGASGLQDTQNAHDHLERTLEKERDQNVRSHAQRTQLVREPIRAPVELGVAQTLILEDCRRTLRRPFGLIGEEFVNEAFGRVIRLRQIPFDQPPDGGHRARASRDARWSHRHRPSIPTVAGGAGHV